MRCTSKLFRWNAIRGSSREWKRFRRGCNIVLHLAELVEGFWRWSDRPETGRWPGILDGVSNDEDRFSV